MRTLLLPAIHTKEETCENYISEKVFYSTQNFAGVVEKWVPGKRTDTDNNLFGQRLLPCLIDLMSNTTCVSCV